MPPSANTAGGRRVTRWTREQSSRRSSSGTTVSASRRARPTGTRRWPAGARRNGAPSGTARGSGPRPTPRSVRSTGRSTPPCARPAWSLTAPVRAVARPAPRVPPWSSARRRPRAASTRRCWRPTSASVLWSVASLRWRRAVAAGRAPCGACRGPAGRRACPRASCGRARASCPWARERVQVVDRETVASWSRAAPRTRTLACVPHTTRPQAAVADTREARRAGDRCRGSRDGRAAAVLDAARRELATACVAAAGRGCVARCAADGGCGRGGPQR